MEAAAAEARRDDRATLAEARRFHVDTLKDLSTLIGTVSTIREQKHRLRWWAGIGLVLGCLLGATVPGFVARLAPTGWQWPERIAARAVRQATLWDAGMRLMRVDDPAAWETLVEATEMWRENHDVIAECKKLVKSGRTTRCVIQIKGDSGIFATVCVDVELQASCPAALAVGLANVSTPNAAGLRHS
jgi:hypothetical protein